MPTRLTRYSKILEGLDPSQALHRHKMGHILEQISQMTPPQRFKPKIYQVLENTKARLEKSLAQERQSQARKVAPSILECLARLFSWIHPSTQDLMKRINTCAAKQGFTLRTSKGSKAPCPRAQENWKRLRSKMWPLLQGLQNDPTGKILASHYWPETFEVDCGKDFGHLRLSLQFYQPYFQEWQKLKAFEKAEHRHFESFLADQIKQSVSNPEFREKLKRNTIAYLNEEERQEYLATFAQQDGYKLFQKGSVVPDGHYIFVLLTDKAGKKHLYLGKKERGSFQHSSLAQGEAVSSAGMLTIKEGLISTIQAYSGHYQPESKEMKKIREFLTEHIGGKALAKIGFTELSPTTYRIIAWVQQNLFP